MKKKLVVVAMLLFAISFSCFAQEAFSVDPSQYVAKAEEKEYTVVVSGKVKINDKWVLKTERFTVVAKSYSSAEARAKDQFSLMYTGQSYNTAFNNNLVERLAIKCETTGNRCDYDFSF